MGKDKLRKFRENLTFDCFIQPEFDEVFRCDHPLKGHWRSDFFHNDNPIVLELGCGKGEYTVALAERDPSRNFIGIDIKGARMWRGAKTATDRRMPNVGFLRTRIEFINGLFAEGEVDEIWITFPDPQLKSRRAKKRLTSPLFLGYYARILSPDGWINLKTDSKHLFGYTNEVVRRYGLPCEVSNADIYGTGYADEVLSVKTAYEKRFLEMGLPITYTRFSLAGRHEFPWFDWEEDEKAEKDNEEARLADSLKEHSATAGSLPRPAIRRFVCACAPGFPATNLPRQPAFAPQCRQGTPRKFPNKVTSHIAC